MAVGFTQVQQEVKLDFVDQLSMCIDCLTYFGMGLKLSQD